MKPPKSASAEAALSTLPSQCAFIPYASYSSFGHAHPFDFAQGKLGCALSVAPVGRIIEMAPPQGIRYRNPKNNVDTFSIVQLKTAFHCWEVREINKTGKRKIALVRF
jgi:hypothetical protein